MKSISFVTAATLGLAAFLPATDVSFKPQDSTTDSAITTWDTGPSAFYFSNDAQTKIERWRWTGARSYVEYANGTARLRGRIYDPSNTSRKFDIDVQFTGYRSSSATPPSGSPKLGAIRSSALYANNGPINPDTWHYYTGMTGTMTGVELMSGWKVQLTRRGEAWQVGYGGNQYNAAFGASCWFDQRVLAQGSKSWWSPNDYGDINIDLTPPSTKPGAPGGKDCIAYYPFDHNSRSSRDPETCSDASSVYAGRSYEVTGNEFCLAKDSWTASSRSSSRYATSYVQINVTPKPDCVMTHKELCFDIERDKGSTIDRVDVRADADRSSSGGGNFGTVLATLNLGTATDYKSWKRYCIDVSSISGLQGLSKPYALRLYFYGSTDAGWRRSQTCLDNVRLCGEGDLCKKPTITRVRNPRLELVTTHCFVLEGTDLDQVTDLRFGGKVISSMSSNDFGTTGYFEKRSDGTLCFYPPLCEEGSIALELRNSACGSEWTGRTTVTLYRPDGNRLATAPEQDYDADWCAFLYGKNTNNYYCVFASLYNDPSRVPGVIDLGIGRNFELLIAFDSPGPKCWKWCIGKWAPQVRGLRLYFQTLVIDLDNFSKLPFEVTNVTSTLFR